MFVLEQRLRRRPRPPHPHPPRRTGRQNRSTLPAGPRRRQARLHPPLPPQRPPHRPRRPAHLPGRPVRPLARLSRARLPSSRHRPAPGPPRNTQTGRLRDQSPPRIGNPRSQTRSNPAHPQYPKNHSSDNGQTPARTRICSRRPSHPENPPKSCKSCFRQSAQLKSQPIPIIPKITVQTTVKHPPEHASVRVAPPILKIPNHKNPANPASDSEK